MGKSGVFCIESEWEVDLKDKHTIRPLLEIFETASGHPFIHRRVATKSELKYFVDLWCKKYSNYKILSFETHGNKASDLFLHGDDKDDWKSINLREIVKEIQGRGKDRFLYLGGCRILNRNEKEIKEFLKETKLKAFIGYTKNVGWVETCAFQLVIFQALLNYKTAVGANNYLEKHEQLVKELGMKFIIR